MKLTLDWLKDFVDVPVTDPADLVDVFESLGLEVEEWGRIEPTFSGVVVGKVLSVEPHPNADKVRLCTVDIGADAPSQIICGAWNFDAGAIVPVAVPGAVLQGDFEIGRRTIRGVESNGMICSEEELGLGDDAAGIMVLDGDYPWAAEHIGADLAKLLPFPDAYYDLAITPNRPDCMSVYGVARELAAYYDLDLVEPRTDVTEVGPPSTASITITDADACPRFVAREVRGLVARRSPHWLRRRLQLAGVRPISNIVDASNYAMLEVGHPTHAFDMDRLGDRVVVRHATAGETITTLDGVERTLEPSDIVVADETRPVAIAGIMGGADTEVHDGTSRVLIEAAYWNPPSILLTSKRLGLRSEASARFERGMDPNFCDRAADRVAHLLQELADGAVAPPLVDEYPKPIAPRSILFDVAEVRRLLGIDLTVAEVADLLRRLGFEVAGDGPLEVTVPTRRPDVTRPADLVEEIARLHGFDNIPDRVRTGTGGGLPTRERKLRKIRDVVVGAGYHEIATFSIIAESDLDALGLPEGNPARDAVAVSNPLNEEERLLRTTLVPGLLRALAVNESRQLKAIRLFEIGTVFMPGSGKLPEQPLRLGFVAGGQPEITWEGQGRTPDVFDATGLWELLAVELGVPQPAVRPHRSPVFHPGRCAEVLAMGTPIGTVGEVHPAVTERFGLTGRVVAGEIDLDELLLERTPWRFEPPSTYPPVIIDLAFAVDDDMPAAALTDTVRRAGGPFLEELTVFDVFAGGNLGQGRKSIAIRLVFRAPDRTLTDDDLVPIRTAIVEAVERTLGGTLRGAS